MVEPNVSLATTQHRLENWEYCDVFGRPAKNWCSQQQIMKPLTSTSVTRSPLVSVKHDVSKRHVFSAAILLNAATLLSGAAHGSTPYEEGKRLVYGPTQQGTIRACPSNVNPNCVSTASTNETYAPVWRSPEPSADVTVQMLSSAVMSLYPAAELVKAERVEGVGEYAAFQLDGLFGKDVLEFLVKPENTRSMSTGEDVGALVTYRSMAGSVKYLWPIQQPLSDLGGQKKRMTEIRAKLGWPLVGCELLECYEGY